MAVLKLLHDYDQYPIGTIVANNLEQWFKYGLLEAGAYSNVSFSDAHASGYTTLERTVDESVSGAVYEGFGPSWVWEQNFDVPDNNEEPIRPSGVWIDGDFYDTATASGVNEHYIDYRTGRVVFPNNIDEDAVVQCEYTIRDIEVQLTDSGGWKTFIDKYKEGYSSISVDSPSGIGAVLKENRVWLPSVFIDVVSRQHSRGLQLGGGEISEIVVHWNIFTDNQFSRDWISDTLNDQMAKRINLYNTNDAPYQLNFNGSLVDNPIEYPELSQASGIYYSQPIYISSSRSVKNRLGVDLYSASVVQSIEVHRYRD